MEAVGVAPAPAAVLEKKLLDLDLKDPAAAAKAPLQAGKKAAAVKKKLVGGDAGYVLEDVPHLADYLPELPTYPNPLQDNPAYSVVKQYFVNIDDTVTKKIVVHKTSARGTHFRRAGPRQRVYFQSDEVKAAIVTCGGLCPGLNTVIRELVCGLYDMYGVTSVVGIEVNTQAAADVVDCSNPKNSKYYVVIVQYMARLNAENIKNFLYALNEKQISKKRFNMRLAPEEESLKFTGFVHNAVTCIGMETDIPIIIDEAITKLDEDFFWLGGGEVDLKLGMQTSQFLNAFNPFVVNCS